MYIYTLFTETTSLFVVFRLSCSRIAPSILGCENMIRQIFLHVVWSIKCRNVENAGKRSGRAHRAASLLDTAAAVAVVA